MCLQWVPHSHLFLLKVRTLIYNVSLDFPIFQMKHVCNHSSRVPLPLGTCQSHWLALFLNDWLLYWPAAGSGLWPCTYSGVWLCVLPYKLALVFLLHNAFLSIKTIRAFISHHSGLPFSASSAPDFSPPLPLTLPLTSFLSLLCPWLPLEFSSFWSDSMLYTHIWRFGARNRDEKEHITWVFLGLYYFTSYVF